MDKLLNIFNNIKNESSRVVKEDILFKNKDNQLFLDVLKFVYNPYIVTGLSTKKVNKKIEGYVLMDAFKPLESITDAMNYLERNNTGRDIDILLIQDFISKQNSEEESELAKDILTKSLKIGITEKTINKVYGKGTIPSFGVMLAESFEKKIDNLKGKFYITLKLDGNRCISVVDDNKVSFFTRTGRPIEGLTELEKEFAELPTGVYDGELLAVNEDDLPSDELFRFTQKILRKDGEKTGVMFYIFDQLTSSEFKNGLSSRTYEQRRNYLDSIISGYTSDTEHIEVLPILYQGEDKDVVPTILKEVEDGGFEGIMVNTASGLYKSKRTNDLLKVKTMKSADLLVMSLEEGGGKYKGKLGRVNVLYKDNLVGVGSGFSDEQREDFWKNPDKIAGKIIEVQYFEESFDEKTKQPSLRLPIFKCIRHDKGVEDISYE